MKKTNLVLATVLASVIGFGASAVADDKGNGERSWKHHSGEHKGGKHGKRGGRHGGGKHMMKRMAKKLNLTDDQKAQMKILRESQKADGQGLRQQMKQLRQDMRNLDSNDATAVAALAARKGQLSEQMFTARNQSRLAFEAILTAEQKAQLATMKTERQAKRAERMKKRQERKAARDNAS